ncbi:MAG: hypothetical protein ABL973_03640 [Micropepsaceae bacterium]
MRVVLNKSFGVFSAVTFVFWCAMHVYAFYEVGRAEESIFTVWVGIGLILISVAYLEFGFRFDDGSRPGFAGLQKVRAMPVFLRAISIILSAYVVTLFLALLLEGSAEQFHALAPVAIAIREIVHRPQFDNHGLDAGWLLGALAGTALVANISFNISAYLLFAEHQRRAATWVEGALPLLLPCVFLLSAGAYLVMGDWLGAAVGLLFALWWIPRYAK